MPRNIRPTVFIALGGTGFKSLKRLRTKLEIEHGGSQRFKHFKYLVVDADGQSIMNDFGPGDPTDVRRVKISASQEEVRNIYANPALFAHIHNFLPPELATDLSASGFSAGANARRVAGRLLFILKLDVILNHLVTLMTDARSAAEDIIEEAPQLGQVAASGCDVVIVGSVAGGTGAGCLIDCGYLVRAARRGAGGDLTDGKCHAYLLTPDHFQTVHGKLLAEKRAVAYATAYATLQEIDYFSQSAEKKRLFSFADWPTNVAGLMSGEVGYTGYSASPPFDNVYVFNTTNAENFELDLDQGTPDGVYDLIADCLAFKTGYSALAVEVVAAQDNDSNTIIQSTPATKPEDGLTNEPGRAEIASKWRTSASPRFGSIGISRVSLKVEKARAFVACQWIIETVSRVIGQPETNVSPQVDADFMTAVRERLKPLEDAKASEQVFLKPFANDEGKMRLIARGFADGETQVKRLLGLCSPKDIGQAASAWQELKRAYGVDFCKRIEDVGKGRIVDASQLSQRAKRLVEESASVPSPQRAGRAIMGAKGASNGSQERRVRA